MDTLPKGEFSPQRRPPFREVKGERREAHIMDNSKQLHRKLPQAL
jgi:hypothetical protein